MLKTIVRFLVILLVAVALGVGIYYLIQPSGTASLNNFGGFRDFGGERGFREGGFSLIGGLAGIMGNLILVAIITFIIVAVQKLFSRSPERTIAR